MAATVSAESLRALFDGLTDHTVGVEEELMLLDPDTLDLLPAAARVHAELGDRVSLRAELPAAEVETASPVCDSIDQAARALAAARRELGAGVAGWARLAGGPQRGRAAACHRGWTRAPWRRRDARRQLPAMRANVGAQTSDRRRYA
jgi:gamma-glutamyl:cysteine ligase YbdK (ATP-grasp superfamily)